MPLGDQRTAGAKEVRAQITSLGEIILLAQIFRNNPVAQVFGTLLKAGRVWLSGQTSHSCLKLPFSERVRKANFLEMAGVNPAGIHRALPPHQEELARKKARLGGLVRYRCVCSLQCGS